MLKLPKQTPESRPAAVEFFKMAGGGNDFVIIDNRSHLVAEPVALARRICTRRLSVGADGLILIESSARATFRMIYFNSDGSRADFCANGTRCAARFAFLNVIAQRKMTIETDAGVVGAEIQENQVALSLPGPKGFVESRPLELDGDSLVDGSFLVVGVPHYVLFPSGDLWSRDIGTLGRAIRTHRDLAPDGANVDFVSLEGRQAIAVRTYERGVEGETLSCGSGVVASVCAAALKGLVDSPVTVLTRSGIRLLVAFANGDKGNPGDIASVRLTGDARLIYRSHLTPDTIDGFDPEWVRNPTNPGPQP